MESQSAVTHRFLNEEEQKVAKRGIIAGFFRSGNIMTRNYIEHITGIYTGSNMITGVNSLDWTGLKGGRVTGPEVEYIGTHFPLASSCPLVGCKVLLLVRNPFDIIDSFWNIIMTRTHKRHMADEEYIKHAELHEKFIRGVANHIDKQYRYWLESQPLPVNIARYEDTVSNTQKSLTDIICFLKDGIDVSASPYQSKIEEAAKKENCTPYAKEGQRIATVKSLHRYSQAQFEHVCDVLGHWMEKLGYQFDKANKQVTIVERNAEDYISKRNEEGLKMVKAGVENQEVCSMSQLPPEQQEQAKREEQFMIGFFMNLQKQEVQLKPLD